MVLNVARFGQSRVCEHSSLCVVDEHVRVTCNKRAIRAIGRLVIFFYVATVHCPAETKERFSPNLAMPSGSPVSPSTLVAWTSLQTVERPRFPESCKLFSLRRRCDLGRLLPPCTKGSLGRMMWTLEATLVANTMAKLTSEGSFIG